MGDQEASLTLKIIAVFLVLFTLGTCAKADGATVGEVIKDVPSIEKSIQKRLQLYPVELSYSIMTTSGEGAVGYAHEQMKGSPTSCNAFYDTASDLIVVPLDADEKILKHEIGHAIVDHYFKVPVPRWLHETLAECAEEATR